jgi:hypothetical protein
MIFVCRNLWQEGTRTTNKRRITHVRKDLRNMNTRNWREKLKIDRTGKGL